jgi:hypothetical protein
MKSLSQIFFEMGRLATMLLSLYSAKLGQHSRIWIAKQFSPSRGIFDRCQTPVWVSRHDLDHHDPTLVTDLAFGQ